MNATQDASNDMQNDINTKLINYNEKQNDLIFETRKRLFKLEKTHNTDVKILCSMSIGICIVCILMCVQFGGGFQW
jgi:hypothetical protein|tara:strand:+ start:236 stop:463 length:228 start_codon:yes stop_codon:yes gene_type:complete